MGQKADYNEYGYKPKVLIKIRGNFIERAFRNEGEARKYLEQNGYTRADLKKGVVKIVQE